MAYSTISKPSLYFNTKLYSGTGSSQAITGVGFQPDWIWFKCRSQNQNHNLFDVIRGSNKIIQTSTSNAEATSTALLTSFDSDGFTVNTDGGVNGSGQTYASWNWKAGTTSGITTDSYTTITPTAYSFNATAGFSIIKYTGNGISGAKYPHGLGVAPKMVIVKCLDVASVWWNVYHVSLGNNSELYLNTTNSAPASTGNGTTPDAVNIALEGTTTTHNGSGSNYIAYCFAEKKGYSKFGTYTGNGTSGVDGAGDGTFVYTGFKPSMIIIKPTSTTGNWQILDNKRPGFNESDNLAPNNNAVENTSNDFVDLVSNGFKLRSGTYSASGVTYIYMAFAEEPLVANVGTNGVPATAR